jgi:hypothetical protein
MSGDTATFKTSVNASFWQNLRSEISSYLPKRKLLSFSRSAGVLLFGCFLLFSLFVLQVVALELSDRLIIFPLYGFFFINFLVGLFLTGLILTSRKSSSRLNRGVIQTSADWSVRLRKIWAGSTSVLNIQNIKAQTSMVPKQVAVLLIIKRKACEEAKPKSRAVSAKAI